jgi:type III secretion protein L
MDMAILINTPSLTVTHDSRVIKAETVNRVVAASALLSEAQQAADTLRQQAKQAADSLQRQAKIAFENEKRRGWQEGWDEAQASLESELAEAAAARQDALHSLAPDLVDLVLEAAAKVVKNVERRHLYAQALEAMHGLLYQARWARLRVAPSQIDEARAALDQAGQGIVAIVSLVADPLLGETDCVFESDRGVCNASLSAQLYALEEALARAVQTIQQQAVDAEQRRRAA